MVTSGIFISYRRQDSDAYAGRLYDRLSTHFGKARIFMDIDMNLGIDFVDEIEERVASCEVLIAVIGRNWLEVKDDGGRRRLDNPKDWVRLEIAAALERNIPVIPALVGDAKMPGSSDLPSVLSNLTRRQAIEISHSRFHPDVDRLIRGLERIVSSTGTTMEVPEGVYVDPETKLMWTIEDNGEDIDWFEANEYAKQLRLGGYSDWRLPTIEELERLNDPKSGNRFEIRQPFQLTSEKIWSSTRERSRASYFIFGPYILGDPVPMDRADARALCVRRSGE